MWDFDEIVQRDKTDSVKYDLRTKLYGSKNIIPMWVADMDFKTPKFIVDDIKKRAEHEIYGYTIRNDSFFKSVIHWMNYKHNWQIKKSWISFSPGVVPAIALSILAYTKPGDKIIAQPPVYFPFFSSIKNNGRQLIYNQLKYDNGNYHFDFEDLKKKIDSRTKMILICNPHNPVGRVWLEEELTKLAEICLKNDILMISDEIHSDLIFEPNKHIPLASLSKEIADNTISTFAPSKTFNVAGLSSSVIIISNPKLKVAFDNYVNDLHIGFGNIFGNVALESAYFKGAEWLNALMDYLEGNIALVKKFIDKPGIKIKMHVPQSTYLLWLDFREYGLKDKELKKMLVQDAKIGLSPGELFGPGGEGFQRMNIACPREVLIKALNNLEKVFGS